MRGTIAAAAAAGGHRIRLICVLLWFVRGEHVSSLSCYDNPNRLMGRAEAAAGRGGPTAALQGARGPIRSLGGAVGGRP